MAFVAAGHLAEELCLHSQQLYTTTGGPAYQSSSARHADAVSGILSLPYLPQLSRERNATERAYFAQHAMAWK